MSSNNQKQSTTQRMIQGWCGVMFSNCYLRMFGYFMCKIDFLGAMIIDFKEYNARFGGKGIPQRSPIAQQNLHGVLM